MCTMIVEKVAVSGEREGAAGVVSAEGGQRCL